MSRFIRQLRNWNQDSRFYMINESYVKSKAGVKILSTFFLKISTLIFFYALNLKNIKIRKKSAVFLRILEKTFI